MSWKLEIIILIWERQNKRKQKKEQQVGEELDNASIVVTMVTS